MVEFYMTTLLALCTIALVLAVTVMLQSAINAQSQDRKLPERVVAPSYASPSAKRRPEAATRPTAFSSARREAKPSPDILLIADSKSKPTVDAQLALIVSAFHAIERVGNNSSALIAARWLPRLNAHAEPITSRIHAGRHKLQLIALGADMAAARIASQALKSLPTVEHTA